MKTKNYIKPEVELIQLDNEISLSLQSAPPDGPGEEALLMPEFHQSNPLSSGLA